jgi:hypothetical protein
MPMPGQVDLQAYPIGTRGKGPVYEGIYFHMKILFLNENTGAAGSLTGGI